MWLFTFLFRCRSLFGKCEEWKYRYEWTASVFRSHRTLFYWSGLCELSAVDWKSNGNNKPVRVCMQYCFEWYTSNGNEEHRNDTTCPPICTAKEHAYMQLLVFSISGCTEEEKTRNTELNSVINVFTLKWLDVLSGKKLRSNSKFLRLAAAHTHTHARVVSILQNYENLFISIKVYTSSFQ